MTFRRFLPLICLGLLAACSASKPPNYYTLVPGAQAPAAAAATRTGMEVIDLMPVTVPASADVPQVVIRTGQGEVVPLNAERWVGPLADEIRSALAARLASRLGIPVVQGLRPDRQSRGLLVQVEIQRFDSTLGGQAILDSVWRVQPTSGPGGAARTGAADRLRAAPVCRSYFEAPAGDDMATLVQAHQRNLAALGDAMASAAASVGAGRAACPG